MEEESYITRLEELQDQFLDLINEQEADLMRANAVMMEFLQIGAAVAIQLEYRVRNKIVLSPDLKESVIHISHIKNLSEILRRRLGLLQE